MINKKSWLNRFLFPNTSTGTLKIHTVPAKNYLFSEFYIAGYRYYDGEKIADSLWEGKPVSFKREPACIHDPGAVEIYAGKRKLGYIPQKYNKIISFLMDQGVIVKGKILKRNFDDHLSKRIKISAFTAFN